MLARIRQYRVPLLVLRKYAYQQRCAIYCALPATAGNANPGAAYPAPLIKYTLPYVSSTDDADDTGTKTPKGRGASAAKTPGSGNRRRSSTGKSRKPAARRIPKPITLSRRKRMWQRKRVAPPNHRARRQPPTRWWRAFWPCSCSARSARSSESSIFRRWFAAGTSSPQQRAPSSKSRTRSMWLITPPRSWPGRYLSARN